MLRELDRKIAALGRELKKQGSKAQQGARESWEDLKAKQKLAKKKMKGLIRTGEEAWEKAKSEAIEALDEVREAYDRTASYFR